ncbi:hypothetical protein AX16_007172 [Volvariella volvacea WC 439]|nr:hypothetical protein AX16_007172 [Volvariella volvacea WC 439]
MALYLSMLPRSALLKTIGVNRMLFELGMDEKYNEIRLISDDVETQRTLEQLNFQSIARRMKRVYIRPAFFPSANKNGKEKSSQSTFSRFIHRTKGVRQDDQALLDGCLILSKATKSLAGCPNVENLTLVLHDQDIIHAFLPFLNNTWLATAQCVRRLSFDLTIQKLQLVYAALQMISCHFTSLEELQLTLSPSLFSPPNLGNFISQTLVPFVDLFKHRI